jgi:Cdc6-like AAA superfamily ATPase
MKEWKRKTTNLKIFKKMASPNEKLLYQTIKELSNKTQEITTQNIASALEKATGKAVKPDELTETLNNLEKHGIIKADTISILDQPRLVWKPNMGEAPT